MNKPASSPWVQVVIVCALSIATAFTALVLHELRRDRPGGPPAALELVAPGDELARPDSAARAQLLARALEASARPHPRAAAELPPGYMPARLVARPATTWAPVAPPDAPLVLGLERPSLENPGGVNGTRPPRD